MNFGKANVYLPPTCVSVSHLASTSWFLISMARLHSSLLYSETPQEALVLLLMLRNFKMFILKKDISDYSFHWFSLSVHHVVC